MAFSPPPCLTWILPAPKGEIFTPTTGVWTDFSCSVPNVFTKIPIYFFRISKLPLGFPFFHSPLSTLCPILHSTLSQPLPSPFPLCPPLSQSKCLCLFLRMRSCFIWLMVEPWLFVMYGFFFFFFILVKWMVLFPRASKLNSLMSAYFFIDAICYWNGYIHYLLQYLISRGTIWS